MRSVLVALALVLSSQAFAQGRVLADYTARVSAQDKVNSVGDRLTTVGAILRQDRANYHRFEQPGDEDTADEHFTNADERARFERLLSRGIVRPDTAREIINGTPLVRVTVFATRAYVEILEP
jgi:hypothetical protein